RTRGDLCQIHLWGQRHLTRVHPEDRLTALAIWSVDDHLAVKAAGAKQGRVQDLWPVGGRQHHDALLRVEAVHLDQELVQGLFPFIMAARDWTEPTGLPQRI